MKNVRISTKWRRISVVVAGLMGLSTLSFNCSPSLFESAVGKGGSSSFGSFSSYEKTNTPYSLLTGEQAFESMLNVTGQSTAPSAAQRTEYATRLNSFSADDNLANISSPLLLATTSLGGEVCNGLVAKEKALAAGARRFFGAINFGANVANNSQDAFLSSVDVLAVSAWGRNLDSDERAIFAAYYAEFKSNLTTDNNAATDNLFITACSAVLSSFDALVY